MQDADASATMPTVSCPWRDAFVAATLSIVGCGGQDEAGSITEALVSGEDLPGGWAFFEATAPTTETDLCGHPRTRLQPSSTAYTAWAIDADDGPIFGERIEQFDNAADVQSMITHPLDVPCTFTRDDGSRWRTEQLDPFAFEDDGRVYLTTSLDRPDSFNYQVSIASDEIALLAVLNTRAPARTLLDDLVVIAWSKAVDEGVAD